MSRLVNEHRLEDAAVGSEGRVEESVWVARVDDRQVWLREDLGAFGDGVEEGECFFCRCRI
jgi:hypothetical protein